MQILVVQFRSEWRIVASYDPATETVAPNHAGVFARLFRQGVKDLDGRLLRPTDGRTFMSALYDYLFLRGCSVRWLHSIVAPHLLSPQREE